MSRLFGVTNLLLISVLGAAAALGVAFIAQYVFDLQPCVLCIWQRWPYAAVIVIGLLTLLLSRLTRHRLVGLALVVLALYADAGIAAFHVGVEQGWWQGTSECGGAAGADLTIEQLRAQILGAPVVRCTDIAWSLFGISMAGWNLLYAAGLGTLGLIGIFRSRRGAER